MASELMCPGVPVTAWATMRALRSNTALARSPASRTIGLKAARCSALACSLTVAMRLCHKHLELDGIERGAHGAAAPALRVAMSEPSSPTTTDHPGRITAVVSRSSTIAGPSKRVPGPRVSRR